MRCSFRIYVVFTSGYAEFCCFLGAEVRVVSPAALLFVLWGGACVGAERRFSGHTLVTSLLGKRARDGEGEGGGAYVMLFCMYLAL